MRTSILKHSFSLLALLFISVTAKAQPRITSITPASGKPGDTIVIVGTSFFGTVATTEVYFGNARVTTYRSASTTTLRVIVPVGATYGPILVFDKVNKKYGVSKQFFSPTFVKPKGSFTSNDMVVSNQFATGTNPYSVAVGDVDGDAKPDAVVVNYTARTVSVLRNTSTVGNVSFADSVNFATGVNPMAVALADMDNDGKLDIIVVNNGSNNVSVYKNTSTASGSVSFASRVNFATGTTGAAPNALAIADMNGDGFQDIVATNGGFNTVSYLENTSSTAISFATKVEYATGTFPQGIAVGDLDANGTLDVVVANNSANTISVLQNTASLGVVSFAAKVDYNVGTAPQSVAMGDITGDGKLDVVVSNYTTGSVSTLRNISVTGAVTLNTAVNKTATPFTETVGITDIDADGKVDVVYANNASSFSVLKNTTTTTTPTYATSVDFTTGSLTKAHAMGDIDGDGKIDAVVITNFNNAIVVVRNAPQYSTNANLSAFIINTTAYTPILSTSVTNYTASVTNATTSVTVKATKAQDSATLQIQLNGGTYTALTSGVNSSVLALNLGENTINIKVTAQDGTTIKVYTFTVTRAAPPTITSISPMSGAVGTSVNLAGTFYSSIPANNVVFFGATQATVTAATTTSLTVTVPTGATYAPITVLNTVSGLSGTGKDYFNTTFKPNKGSIDSLDITASANFGVNTYPGKTVIGDIDGDGKADAIVLDNSSPKFSVLRNTSNTGAVNFAPKIDFTTLSSPESIALGDINNDGKLDVIVVDFLTDSVSIFRNTSTSGTISFAPRVNILCGLSIGVYTSCVVGDIDGDGKQDIVVTNIGQNEISVLRNTSTSTTNISFAFFTTFTTGNYPASIAIGDINKDGKADIVTANRNPANATGTAYYVVSVLKNTSVSGTMSFATKQDFTVDGQPSFVALGDINGDGVNDIITGNVGTNNVSVLINYSDNTGLFMGTLQSFTTGANSAVLGVADIDGDGKLDIVNTLTGKGLAVLRNTNTVNWSNSFTAPIILAKNINISDIVTGDIDGDGKVDIIGINTTATNDSLIVLRNTPILSRNNNLSSLTISTGTLVPAFDSLTTAYNVSVHNPITSLTVTPTKAQDSAKIEIQYNGGTYTNIASGVASSLLSLNTGENTINLKVTAQNGNVKIYTIVVYRACLAPSSTTNLAVCPSQLPYQWNGLTFTTAGSKSTILTTSSGCDSSVTLNLSVKSTTSSLTSITTCDSAFWGNTWYKQSGLYTYHSLNSVGCDSAARVNLTIKKSTTSWTDVVTCDSTKWNGVWYTKSGFYTVHFTNKAGCDSAASLNLTVNDKPTGAFSSTSGDICVGDSSTISFNIPNTTNKQFLHVYTLKDTIFEIGTASFGADTRTTPINTNIIAYLPNSSSSNQACSTLFPVGSFTGKVALIDRGTCTFAAKAKAAQDDGAIGIIIVNNVAGGAMAMSGTDPTITIPVISISQADGQIIKNWINSGQNVNGFSVVHTPTYLWSTGATTSSIVAKPTQTTIYNVNVSYENGCSQTFYHALLVRKNSTSTTTLSACDSLVWNGATYKTSGQYVYHTSNSVGCDSAATLNLTIKKSTSSWTDILTCDSAIFNGITYKTSGQYIFHTTNAAGCDSTSVLNVTLKKSTSSTQSISICPSALPYVWNGLTFTAAGSKTKTGLTNSAGCDSSATLNLTVRALPNAGVISGNSSFCFIGGSTTLSSSGDAGGVWTSSNSARVSVTSGGKVTASMGGNYIIYYTVTNVCSTAVASFNIKVNVPSTTTTLVSVCNSYTWGGTTYTSSGIYTKTGMTNVGGCDSTATLDLTIKKSTTSITTQTACSSYTWNGITYTTSGTYTKTGMLNKQGCDSVATLILTIKPVSTSTTNLSICPSALPYVWNGLTFTAAGSKTYHTLNSVGCDSSATLNLTVKTNTSSTTNLSICPSALPYSWNGIIFTTAGSQTKTGLTNSKGCDSSATLNLTVKTTTSSTTNLSICPSALPYSWNGLTFTTAGSQTKLGLVNSQGCDSSATLNLTVKSVTSSTILLNICQTQLPYTISGLTFSQEGKQSIILTNANGCDSVVTYILSSVQDGILGNAVITQPKCDSLFGSISAPYYDYIRVFRGSIDSTDQKQIGRLNIAAQPTSSCSLSSTNPGLLASDTKQRFYESYTLTNTTGAAACVSVNLKNYNPSNTYTVAAYNGSFNAANPSQNYLAHLGSSLGLGNAYFYFSIPANATFEIVVSNYFTGKFFGDYTLEVSGLETPEFSINNGLNWQNSNSFSAVPIGNSNLIMRSKGTQCTTSYFNNPIVIKGKVSTSSTNNLNICPSALPYSWNGLTFSTAGSQTKTGLVNSQGCDSSATLNLTVKTNTSSTNNLSICPSQLPYSWNGLTFTAAGSQTKTGFTNSQGCDSSATLNLTVKTSTSSTTNLSICPSQLPYSWNGLSFTAAGFQTKTGFTNSQGCDSSATLNLTVKTNTSSTSNLSICPSQLPYSWNGLTFTAAGSQTKTGLTNSQGCDSSATLNLTVKTNTSSTTNLSICPSALPYSWNGLTFTAVGSQTKTGLINSQGCDSSATLNLTVKTNTSSTTNLSICPSQLPYSWNGLSFTGTGSQTKTGLTNSQGCDSSATLNLTVKTNTSSTNNVSICPSQLPYSWNGLTFTAAGSQTKTGLTNSQGCDSSATLNLTISNITYSTLNHTICSGQSYLGHSTNGVFNDTLTNSAGCDSVRTLNLTVTTSVTPTISIATASTSVCKGYVIVYNTTVSNEGINPLYQWYKNGIAVGTNSSVYKDSLLNNQDSIWCVLTSSETCVTANNIKSNVIKMNVSLGITGAIKTPTGNAISKVALYRKGSITDMQIVDGKYNSSCIDIANSVSLRPTKNNDITKANGVTSVDVLLIQRHILNTSKLNSAYKLIAADVDGNKAINSVDILRMKRLILGTDTTFTSTAKGNRLWEFIDSAYTFPDTTNPFPFKDSISFTNLTSNKINQTFIGVKLGDVNYDWNATVAKAINSRDLELKYSIDNRKLATINDVIRIPITVNNFKDLVALQYTLHFDNKQYEFIGIENNKLGIDFNDRKANTTGNISMLWTDKNAVEKTLEDGTELFTLVLKVKWEASNIELKLNNSITEIAAWNKDYSQNNIILNKSEIKNNQQDPKNEWLSLGPNPTTGLIRVNISSETNKTISFELTDAQGKLILKQSVELQKGNNNITLNLKQNCNIATGIYLLKAIGLGTENSKRIIVR